jgi:plastocyanin domain-containing protein
MQQLLSRIILSIAVFFYSAVVAYPQDQAETYTATVDQDGIQHVRIIGGSYFFKPNIIVVKKDLPVELTVSKEPGLAPHSIVANAPEAGIVFDESLNTDTKVIRFTPKAAGKYVFYCKNKLLFFSSHREKGMQGIIEVVD